MKLYNTFGRLACFLLLLLAFGSSQAKADTIYQVSGTLTIAGNSSNPGVSETINYCFEFDPSLPNLSEIVGTPVVSSSGPLGSLTIGPGDPQNSYIGFYGPGVEIDLVSLFFFNHQTSSEQFSSTVWECLLSVCPEFYPGPAVTLAGPTGYGLYWDGTASATVSLVPTPEPGTLSLFVLSLLALGLAELRKVKLATTLQQENPGSPNRIQ